jgi:uncharacterized zinc-type alcohol dehydrogenase-like protein
MQNKPTAAFAAQSSTTPLAPFPIKRRDVLSNDVAIKILYCGVCHSDIHQARNEWGGSQYPIVPGHEIVGTVTAVGENVTKYKVGDTVGVGCLVNSCRDCSECNEGLEQFCAGGVFTYNSTDKDGTITFGGYSTNVVVDQNFVVSIKSSLPLSEIAPLLCAGITTYSPLKHWNVKKGSKVAVMGLGGLGHMAVKIAHAMGAEVTVLSSSDKKREDAVRLGAHAYAVTSVEQTFEKYAGYFDLILNSVSGAIGLEQYLSLLRRDGTMVLLGVPEQPGTLHPFPLIMKRRNLAGSLIGGIAETQEMLDFCATHNIGSDVEVIPMNYINEAYERMIKGDVRYRFVIDMSTLS